MAVSPRAWVANQSARKWILTGLVYTNRNKCLLTHQVNFPLCTIAHTPRLPEHCVEYAKVLVWPQEKPFGGKVREALKGPSQPLLCFCLHLWIRLSKLLEISTKNT